MPWPLSVIWRSFRPPSLMRISICVDPASMEFSISSLSAFEGRWIISPAAILSTTYWVRVNRPTRLAGKDLFVESFDGADREISGGWAFCAAGRRRRVHWREFGDVLYVGVVWWSTARLGNFVSPIRSAGILYCMYLTPPPLPMNHLSHEIDKIEARATNRTMCI
jgi:hypothetical protein